MELVIARTATATQLEGRKFKNIRFFAGQVVKEATKVFVEPGDEATEAVVEAYKKAGIDVSVGLPKKAAEVSAPEPVKAGK